MGLLPGDRGHDGRCVPVGGGLRQARPPGRDRLKRPTLRAAAEIPIFAAIPAGGA